MSDTMTQVDNFCRFAEQRVLAGEKLTIAELFREWLQDPYSGVDPARNPRAVDPEPRDAKTA